MCLSVLLYIRALFILTPGSMISVKNPNVLTGIEKLHKNKQVMHLKIRRKGGV